MARFLVSSYAEADLMAIRDYLAMESPAASQRVGAALRHAFAQLAKSPYMGHLREDIVDARYRVWTVFSYYVIYRPEPKPVPIARVIHGSRDLARVLGTRTP